MRILLAMIKLVEDRMNVDNDTSRGEVRVILLDGTELKGQIRGFDNFTLIVGCKNSQSLVYKHAIASITGIPNGSLHSEGKRNAFD